MNQKSDVRQINFLKKFTYCLFAFIGFPFLIGLFTIGFINIKSQIELLTTVITVSYFFFAVLALLSAIVWQVRDVRKRKSGYPVDNKRIVYYCILLCRYSLSAIIIFYGFQKLMVDQLHASYYWYGDELGKLTGMQLTWSFFGYSKIYNSIIAIVQIIGGGLLLFRRTTLLGALFLLPVLVNIALIDYNYDITAKDIITALLLMDIFLVSISLKPLLSFFLYHQTVNGKQVVDNYSTHLTPSKLLKKLSVIGVIVFAILPNYLQMKPSDTTDFEGAWDAKFAQDFTDTIPEKNKKLTLRLFVNGHTATVKKTYQYQDFALAYDSTKKYIQLKSTSDTIHPNFITGRYKFVRNDSLIFTGRDGKDSVLWVFKRTSN